MIYINVALISERKKQFIIANCPKVQIGGMKNNYSSEKLIIVKHGGKQYIFGLMVLGSAVIDRQCLVVVNLWF